MSERSITMKKTLHVIIIAVLLLSSLLVFQGCGSVTSATAAPASTESVETTADTEVVMTLEELAQYNGKDGNPAYIAVDGVIYDVSDVSQWKDGEHNGFSAGQDLTDEIKNISPHGVSKLTGLPVVGRLEG